MTTKLNPKNKLATLDDISCILKRGGITQPPKNIKYYIQAFTHKSYTIKNGNVSSCNSSVVPLRRYSLEQYEFVGDSFVGKNVCLYLYNRFQSLQEGHLTKFKQRIVDCKTLASFGRYLQFQEWCLISTYMENTSGRNGDKLMEDVFEAFVFALYLDLGEQVVSKFIINVMENVIDFSEIILDDNNYKHQLLEVFQKKWALTPNYKKISEIGPPHQKTYKMSTLDYFGNTLGYGTGGIKKDAEQASSKNALEFLKQIEQLLQKPKRITTTITNFKIHESHDILNIFSKIQNDLESIDKSVYNKIYSVLENNKVFRVEYDIGNKHYTHTIQYKKDEYTFYKRNFENDNNCLDYLRAYHQLKHTIQ
jgi:ribonuclease-3